MASGRTRKFRHISCWLILIISIYWEIKIFTANITDTSKKVGLSSTFKRGKVRICKHIILPKVL
jgi:hypothetical protein